MPDPQWRFCVAKPVRDASGTLITAMPIVTWLDRLASDRQINMRLNAPSDITGTVPSDNPEINILDSDGFPFLAEGVRTILGFRKENDTPPYYVNRANGVILQITDDATTDTARSTYFATDGWGFMNTRPCVDFEGRHPGDLGLIFGQEGGDEVPAGEIALKLLLNSIVSHGSTFIDPGPGWGGTGFWGGVVQATPNMAYQVQAGTTVGQAWSDLIEAGLFDIVLMPIYDPVNRPGYLWEMSILAPAGTPRYEATFAWDLPGRSVTGQQRTFDGTTRVNKLRYHSGQGGPPIPPITNAQSVGIYGQYWGEQFFPKQKFGQTVNAMGAEHLTQVAFGPQVMTIDPAAGVAPSPFTDYYLGDTVTAWSSANFRDTQPTDHLNPYKRILEIPISLDDNGTETVSQLVMEPGEGPPVVTELFGTDTHIFVANNARQITLTHRRPMAGTWGGRF